MKAFADRVQLLQSESERIQHDLQALPADAWSQPSICPEWQVQDIVAHLVGVAEFYADNIARGMQNDTSAPAGRPPAGAINAEAAAPAIAQRSIEARKSLGPLYETIVRFELSTGEVTYGMFENLSIGHHKPYGFDSFEAVAP